MKWISQNYIVLPLEHTHYDRKQEWIVEYAKVLWQNVKNLHSCQWEEYQEKV